MKKIDSSKLSDIKNKIDTLKENPNKGKKLTGNLKNYRSLRVGDYRIIYEIINEEIMIFIVDIGHRSTIYK